MFRICDKESVNEFLKEKSVNLNLKNKVLDSHICDTKSMKLSLAMPSEKNTGRRDIMIISTVKIK